MHLRDVKLVVTDMDGTLLNSKGEVSDSFFELFKKLSQYDIHFVAASGRQYYSIVNKLAPVKDEITVIAENGGIALRKEEQLLIRDLPKKITFSFLEEMRKIKGAYLILCGKDRAYIECRDDAFINTLKEYYERYEIVDDLTKVDHDLFLKIASYHFESSEQFIYPKVKHLENEYQVKVSGANWLDISHPKANKGNALQLVQKKLGIHKAETMVFGDYNNDLEMMELAHFSYAMENAHENIKEIANFNTSSNDDQGVEKVLEELLRAKA
ncbi:HAD family hydrolase [Flavobacteriaceae bacterium M23B6Z8]